MKRINKFVINHLVFIIVFTLLIMPTISFAAPQPLNSLVPCDNSAANPCGFNQLMSLVNGTINFILFKMVVPIAAVMFAYAGFLMVTAGGEAASARTKAKGIFTNAVLGLIFAVAAWLIISTILAILGYDGTWIGLKIAL